ALLLACGAPGLRRGGPLLRGGAPLLACGAPALRRGGPLLRGGAPLLACGAPALRCGGPLLGGGAPLLACRAGSRLALGARRAGGTAGASRTRRRLPCGRPALCSAGARALARAGLSPCSCHLLLLVSESGGNDKLQYARYLGCHSAGTTSFLLQHALNDDDSLLVQRAHCNVYACDIVRCSLLG